MYVTLRCKECENTNCPICPIGKYIDDNNLCGCTRLVSNDDAAQYYHLLKEVAPFMYMNTSKEYKNTQYKNIISFLEYLYTLPIGTKINKNGKANAQK